MKDDLKEYKQKLEKELSAYMELPVSERSAAAVRGMAECWEQVDKLGKCMCASADFSKEDAKAWNTNMENDDGTTGGINRSECIPFAFRVYATYEVNSRLSDLKIHSIIDKLNPNLRSIENFNGKQRIREFYAMSPEDAYSILEAIAEIHGCADKLKRIAMDEAQKQAEETAQEIDDEHKERQSPFRFSMCNIQPGEEIEYCNNPEIKCTIVDDKTVSYQGQIYSLSALAQLLTGSKYSVAGPRYFKYRGEWLNDVRHRQER